jgi:glycopeptide antibiotics resistance protein
MLPYHNPLPWVGPGTLAFAIIGVFVSGSVARFLRTRRVIAWLLVVSLAGILFATLVPLNGVFEASPTGTIGCNLSTLSPVRLTDFLSKDDRAANVFLFIPLGLALGLLPRSRRTALMVLGGVVLPVFIEATQGLLPILHRACESGDVIDNVTGLLVGWVGGMAAGAVIARLASIVEASPTSA